MSKNFRQLFIETLWLIGAAMVTMLILVVCTRWQPFESNVDFHLYDTYYVVAWHIFILPVFLMISLVVSLVREFRSDFRRRLPVIIILATGVLLILMLSIIQRQFPVMEGWTEYPALEALAGEESPGKKTYLFMNFVSYALTGMQVMVTLVLMHVSYRHGKRQRI